MMDREENNMSARLADSKMEDDGLVSNCEGTHVREVTGSQTYNWSSQPLSPLPRTSLASLKSGVSGPWIACSGGVDVSTTAFRLIEYFRPRSEDGQGGALDDVSAKTMPTRHKINNAARIVGWVKADVYLY
jgi:hypothetical protein